MGARPALMHAVANGYVDVARALLEAKTDPDLTDDRFGRRPLEIAALAGNRDLCDLLLKHGAADDIYTAIFRGDEKRVAMRIEAEPKFAKHAGGRMGGVLSAAVLARKPRIVKMLIDAGADPNGLPFGGNPLKLAATFDHVECARVLLENGAQLRVRRPRSSWWSRDYCPALYEAADNGSPGVLRLLFKHGVSLARDDYPRNPALRLAAEENRPECVKILIDNGADLKAHGLLAATHALDRWHIAPIRVLLENGLDPAAADRYGRTILHHDFADAELVKLGLKHGMSAKAATLWGETPLHTMARSVQLYYQCTSQDDKACKPFADGAALLIKHGAEMEARSARGWTPLLGAAARGHGGFVRALHRLGAKLDARHAKGRSTLHLACGELTTDELAWGPIYNAKASDRAEERLDTVRYLLREGTPDTDLRAANGCTALHAAVRANLPEVARLLAASGASLTVKDSTGKTPLDGANAKLRAELLAARKKAHRE
jgi:ankyrin repeat protein